MQKEKFYITTAIAYTSRKPHIGNTYEVVLTDAIARFNRLIGKDVFFLTGTDEHGQKIEQIANECNITPKEYEILTYLIKNKNIAISREQLLCNVWGYDYYGDDRTVDTHIKMLRNNLGKYRNHIVTVRSIGYKYVEDKE